MDINDAIENWSPERFKKFVDGIIETLSSDHRRGPFGRFHDLLLELAWATRRVAEFDERLAASFVVTKDNVPQTR